MEKERSITNISLFELKKNAKKKKETYGVRKKFTMAGQTFFLFALYKIVKSKVLLN